MPKIISQSIPNIPWQDKPQGYRDVIWRFNQNPIIDWNPIPCAARLFNSAVVPFQGGFAGVFRADHKNGRPHLHKGTSEDGMHWTIDPDPIQWVNKNGQSWQPDYAYDPRVVQIEGKFYITWCTDNHGATIGLGETEDFKIFILLDNPFLPFNRNGVLFPRKVNNKYLLLSRPSDSGHTPFGDIFISESPDLVHWGKHSFVMGKGGDGWWQGTKIGPGPVPIETEEGWLLFYHGVSNTCNGFVYSMGAALLDLENPAKVLYRTRDYLLTPEKDYETTGFVPNVIFPCAALVDDQTGRIAIYYGAADTYTGLAFGKIDEIIGYLKKNFEVF
ncbi:MAG: glycoside hydrolase family 130 protein [Spirochaetes bacterium]|nr:glycoside hydrolase family 130 protein [Spirochaetota bacterium]